VSEVRSPSVYWPLFELRVRTPRLILRAPDDDDIVTLAGVAARGIHDPGFMPFAFPWTERSSPELEREALKWWWRCRGEWTPESWRLNFAVECDGELLGLQDVIAEKFAIRRTVDTGSWLGRPFHGRGIGKEMREAVLHFAFAGLGAEVAYSEAFADNAASVGVSRAVGYEPNGDLVRDRKGEAALAVHFKMTRARWEARRRDDIVIEHLEPCLDLFGLPPADGGTG
jgi:RimJ/RimL family protein N-acetyltransferase